MSPDLATQTTTDKVTADDLAAQLTNFIGATIVITTPQEQEAEYHGTIRSIKLIDEYLEIECEPNLIYRVDLDLYQLKIDGDQASLFCGLSGERTIITKNPQP